MGYDQQNLNRTWSFFILVVLTAWTNLGRHSCCNSLYIHSQTQYATSHSSKNTYYHMYFFFICYRLQLSSHCLTGLFFFFISGPMVGLLQRGHPVTLDDGTVIRPEQVTDMPVMDNRPFLSNLVFYLTFTLLPNVFS